MPTVHRFQSLDESELAVPAAIMETAASIAQEISEKWPFCVARLRVELLGAPIRPELRSAIAEALTLGLSGHVHGTADARKIAGIFALQQRMKAIRLAGRWMIAFHPGRDLQVLSDQQRSSGCNVRATVFAANGQFIGQAERAIRHGARRSHQAPSVRFKEHERTTSPTTSPGLLSSLPNFLT